jgi:hypothetical protein
MLFQRITCGLWYEKTATGCGKKGTLSDLFGLLQWVSKSLTGQVEPTHFTFLFALVRRSSLEAISLRIHFVVSGTSGIWGKMCALDPLIPRKNFHNKRPDAILLTSTGSCDNVHYYLEHSHGWK